VQAAGCFAPLREGWGKGPTALPPPISPQKKNNFQQKCFFVYSEYSLPITHDISTSHFLKKNFFFFFSRPLLSLTRYEIKQTCKVWNLPILPDKSNQFVFYTRNRLRKQLLPLLRFYFNPKIDKNLFKFAEFSVNEQIYINAVTNIILSNYTNLLRCAPLKSKYKALPFLNSRSDQLAALPLTLQQIIFKKVFLQKKF
jgi:hypothetical protein